MAQDIQSGFMMTIKNVIKQELMAMKPNEYLSVHSFMEKHNFTLPRISQFFLTLEREGFMRQNNIEVAYYYPRKNLKTKIYIKK